MLVLTTMLDTLVGITPAKRESNSPALKPQIAQENALNQYLIKIINSLISNSILS